MRQPLDFYPTPAQLTKELLKRVDISGTVFECCAGDGAIARELEATHLDSLTKSKIEEVFTNDINPKHDCTWCVDATDISNWNYFGWDFDWVITNPPFNEAHKIVPLAWHNCATGIAMLLRLTYLEPAGNRGEWLQENSKYLTDLIFGQPRPSFTNNGKENSKYLTDLIIFGQPRPSFTNNGKVDSCTTAWFVWQKNPKTEGTKLHFVYDWKH